MTNSSVLIIDDDENIRNLYKDAVEVAGMQAYVAADGKSGVELALKEHPDVILMDIMMPEMNGHEAIEKLRFDNWGKHAKVIFLTNFSDPEHVVKAVEAQSAEFIVKANTDVKEVINKIRTVMHT